MKKLLSALFIAVMICGTWTSVYAGSIKLVRFGTEGAYPPFNLVDKNGKLQGFDIDIAKALAKAMGVKYTFVVQDWDGLIPGLQAKKYDAIVASMAITKERMKKVDFTDKYYMTPARFVVKKGTHVKFTKAGLKGKIIGVQRGTTHENFIHDKFGDVVKIKVYATQDEANMDLVAGRVDMVIADSVVLLEGFLNTKAGKDFEFQGPAYTDARWYGSGIGIAVRKGDKKLLGMLNKAIKQIRADGTYQKINSKYFNFDVYGK